VQDSNTRFYFRAKFQERKELCIASLSTLKIKATFFINIILIYMMATLLCAQTTLAATPEISTDNSSTGKRLRVGLALAGGGTRGCAHIGVLRVLEKEGIPVDCIAGTSMGAIVGGLYASGVSLDEIEELICSNKMMNSYQTVPIPVRFALVPFFAIPHLFGWHPYDGLYRGGIFANFIRKNAKEDEIEKFKIKFAAVAGNLLDGKPFAINHGDIGKAVQASSAIPFLRRPVEIEDKLLIDGGVVMNLPVEQVRELGADFVVAVDIDDNLKNMEKKDFRKVGSVSKRAVNMQLSAIDSYQTPKADFVMHPDVTGIALLDGNIKDARKAISAGEEVARKLLPALKTKLQESSVSLAGKVINKEGEKSE
jgi:NTE family protein